MTDDKTVMLKNFSHLFVLDVLIAMYHDALVVQTNLAVEMTVSSMCLLAQHTTEGWSANVNRFLLLDWVGVF
nr:hypothetical protein [Mycobacterium uberis]